MSLKCFQGEEFSVWLHEYFDNQSRFGINLFSFFSLRLKCLALGMFVIAGAQVWHSIPTAQNVAAEFVPLILNASK